MGNLSHRNSSVAEPPKGQLAVPDQPAVDNWVRRYSEDKRKSFQGCLDRGRPYAVRAQEIFEQKGLPKDLIWVALVESGFSPSARSHADAVGMWQFIATTGKRFGLDQNEYVDERRHPFKAAEAAADYLSFLHDTFGSWSLALAAYNAGENGVQRALDQTGVSTFWELAERNALPSETCDYVPKVLAAVKIMREPTRYGFDFYPESSERKHEIVCVPGGVRLTWLGKQIGIDEYELKSRNPELCKGTTPPGASVYELCVPVGTGECVEEVLAARSLPPLRLADADPPRSSSSKDTPAASRAKTSSKGNEKAKPRVVASKPGERRKPPQAGNKSRGAVWYPVRKGDTLTSIAGRFGVPVEELRAHNDLNHKEKLVPGRVLSISTREQATGASARKRN
jgi:membrane-bound lytic murein transglycosylase D